MKKMLKSSLLSLFKMPLLRELTVYVYPSTFSRFADKIIQLYLSTLSRNMEHAIFRSPSANTSY